MWAYHTLTYWLSKVKTAVTLDVHIKCLTVLRQNESPKIGNLTFSTPGSNCPPTGTLAPIVPLQGQSVLIYCVAVHDSPAININFSNHFCVLNIDWIRSETLFILINCISEIILKWPKAAVVLGFIHNSSGLSFAISKIPGRYDKFTNLLSLHNNWLILLIEAN